MDMPLGNKTALRHDMYHGWMPSPDTRSTTDILWTCLATIVLCVYTAVHLNLPEPGEPERWQALRRAKWVVIAILAPELVLQCAWKQYSDARYIQDNLKQEIRRRRTGSGDLDSVVRDDAPGESSDDIALGTTKLLSTTTIEELSDIPNEETITLTYAFYAVMGGFRLRTSKHEPSYCVGPQAVLDLANDGIFWNVSTTSINDRSKADSLAKFLTVVQVVWMLIQCTARRATNLPLTLLEIHTFIHAICAFIMFILWFKKPLNVRDATVRTISADTPVVQRLWAPELHPEGLPPLVVRRVNIGRGWKTGTTFSEKYSFYHILEAVLGGDGFGHFKTQTEQDINASGITFIQVVYGCLHASAWTMPFPSSFEKWAWRTSCIVIAVACAFLMFSIYVWDKLFSDVTGILESLVFWTSIVVSGILAIGWIFARAFIVIESIIALRSVPIGVYAAISWATYVPHI